MAPHRPTWIVDFPWSITLPTDRPLPVGDLKRHDEILPGHGPHDRCHTRVQHPDYPRCVLPYLIPQSQGITSRFLLAWAFVAPLVQLDEPSVAMPLAAMRRVMPEYDPLTQVVITQEALATEGMHEFFHTTSAEPCVWNDQVCVVLRIREEHVVVAPIDTPVHRYNESFYGCCIP